MTPERLAEIKSFANRRGYWSPAEIDMASEALAELLAHIESLAGEKERAIAWAVRLEQENAELTRRITKDNAEDILTLPAGSILISESENTTYGGTVWEWAGGRLAELGFSETGAHIVVADREKYYLSSAANWELWEVLPLPLRVLMTELT